MKAGEIIAATIPDGEAEPIIDLLSDNDRLGLNDEQRERLWWRNAAEIYGLEEPAFAQE